MADVNEAMKNELNERGEAIIAELGLAARSLLKNSDLHEEIMRSARYFANQETSLYNSALMFNQMNAIAGGLHEKVKRVDASLQEVPKICDMFLETERILHTFIEAQQQQQQQTQQSQQQQQ